MTLTAQKELIARFTEEVWNQGNTSHLTTFLHPGFTDHSLPPALPQNAEGLKQWIAITHQSFQPLTVIEELLAEPGKCIARISMHMKHTGEWRGIPATGATVTTGGYRSFQFKDGLIIAHRALIDGNTLEQQLRGAVNKHACAVKP